MVAPLETKGGGLAKDMTLRDAAALAALTGILANPNHPIGTTYGMIAADALRFADALLIERERGE